MARSMLSFGMLCARATWIALRSRGLPLGSPPPVLAAMVISFDNLLKILPRLASIAPLNRLTFDHLLCPAIQMRIGVNSDNYPDKYFVTSNETPRERMAGEEKI